jgi:hypothetical protein
MRKLKIGRPLLLIASLLSCAALVPAATQAAGKVSAGPPAVNTGGVGHVSGTSATLLGVVDPRTFLTSYYFQYGPTIAYGKQTTPGTLAAGVARVKVGQAVTGLLPGYHYRLVASNAAGTKLGSDRTYIPKTSRTTKFVLPKTSEPTIFGGAFVLSGSITGTGNANRKLALQSSPYPFLTPFAPVGLPIVTDATGHFVFRVATLSTSTQFRVSTLDPRPVLSPVVTQHVAVRVTLKVRTTAHKGLVRLYGTVTPAAVGARLAIQLRKAARPGRSEKSEERTTKYGTRFTSVVKRGTKTVSRFSMIVSIRDAGHYRASVEINKGGFVSGASPSITLAADHSVKAKKKH